MWAVYCSVLKKSCFKNFISGCGKGVVCPASQQASALCDRCDFNTITTQCGVVQGDLSMNKSANSSCSNADEQVYTGLALSYTGK